MMFLTPITIIAWFLLTYCKDDPEKVKRCCLWVQRAMRPKGALAHPQSTTTLLSNTNTLNPLYGDGAAQRAGVGIIGRLSPIRLSACTHPA